MKSCPHTYEQSRTTKKKMRHIIDMGLTLLTHSIIPFHFLNFAFETLVFMINCIPSKFHGIPLITKLFKITPKHSFFEVFRCKSFPLLRSYNQHKFSFQTHFCVFLGYSPSQMGYICLDI